jgi:hypothetical protein
MKKPPRRIIASISDKEVSLNDSWEPEPPLKARLAVVY